MSTGDRTDSATAASRPALGRRPSPGRGFDPPASRGHRGLFAFILFALTVIVWNGVFDGRMKQGIWDYVDRQQRYVAGDGPWTDVDAAMRASVSRGLRDATLAALGTALLVCAVGRRARS